MNTAETSWKHLLSAAVVWCTLMLVSSALPLQAAAKTIHVPADGSVDITLSPWFENVPSTGMVPMTVIVRNRSQTDGMWQVLAVDQDYRHGGTMQSILPVTAAGGAETRTHLLVPLMPSYGTRSGSRLYKNIRLSVSGPGVMLPGYAGNLGTGSGTSHSSGQTSFTLLSEGFDVQLSSSWKSRLSDEWAGAVVEMADAPADWRGYSGVAQLWLMEPEWQLLAGSQREALLSWVAQGGSVIIIKSSGASQVTLPDSFGPPWDGKERRHGLGTLEAVEAGLAPARASSLVEKPDDIVFERSVGKPVKVEDSLAALVPPLKMNGTLIFTFVAIFGAVVGPVNLFWLARGSRRPRLFWTTPLISFLGTSVLIAIMVLQDGFGGTGARVTLALVLPQQKQMTLVQEQMAKTGILLGHAFSLPAAEAAWISPVPGRPEEGFVRTGPGVVVMGGGNDKHNFAVRSGELGEGWFASRSMQSHLICSQRLNRGGIEVGGGDAPYVVSSLNTALRTFFYQDPQGRVWKAEAVPVGQKTILKAATTEQVMEWKKASVAVQMNNEMRVRIGRCLPLSPGWFFAEAAEPAKIAVPTLSSIQWPKDRAFIGGECTPAASRP